MFNPDEYNEIIVPLLRKLPVGHEDRKVIKKQVADYFYRMAMSCIQENNPGQSFWNERQEIYKDLKKQALNYNRYVLDLLKDACFVALEKLSFEEQSSFIKSFIIYVTRSQALQLHNLYIEHIPLCTHAYFSFILPVMYGYTKANSLFNMAEIFEHVYKKSKHFHWFLWCSLKRLSLNYETEALYLSYIANIKIREFACKGLENVDKYKKTTLTDFFSRKKVSPLLKKANQLREDHLYFKSFIVLQLIPYLMKDFPLEVICHILKDVLENPQIKHWPSFYSNFVFKACKQLIGQEIKQHRPSLLTCIKSFFAFSSELQDKITNVKNYQGLRAILAEETLLEEPWVRNMKKRHLERMPSLFF